MKVRDLSIHTILFSALLITLSATSVSAQGKVKFKYVPAKAGTKPVSVPYVVNPNLSRAAQKSITRWSGVAVLRSNATPKAKPPLVTPSPTTVKPLSAKDLTPAATSAKISIFPAQTSSAPVQAAAADTGTNLTGVQVLATYFPTWRQELGGMFSKEQLDAVEKAFADTDEWMFVRDENGELQARNKDEWNYEERFLTILQDSGVSFTPQQINRLVGKRGVRGFTFKLQFIYMNALRFSCAKKMKPRSVIYKDGHRISRDKMTEEENREVVAGIGLNWYHDHPLIQGYMHDNRIIGEKRSAEEYLALARQYTTKPRSIISKNGHTLSREEMSEEEWHEVQVGKGLYYYRNNPQVKAYVEKHRRYAIAKSPEEYVALARQYPTKPRAQISKEGHILSREEMSEEEWHEVQIGRGLCDFRHNPLVQAYWKENRLRAENQTTAQLYTALVQFIRDHGRFPLRKESFLHKRITDRFYRYKSTMVDGKYQDPWLQKIYELKTTVQNAPEGKFTLTPDGQGGYILEIEEPALEEEVTAPQPVEEVAPAAPSPHTIRLRVNEQTKNLIESVRDAAALERRKFSGWLRAMHEPENLPQIVDKNTFDALHTLSKAINFDYRNSQNRRPVTYLLETVNNYVGALGEQPELGTFYKLIYRGKVDDTMLPSADNFHLVAEEQGLSWDGALAPQVEKVNRLLIQATKQDTPYSVYLDGDEEMLTTIRTEKNVPAKTIHQDLSTVLKHLLPPGYEVRMGLHEIGISGKNMSKFRRGYLHLHLEHASVPDVDMEGLLIDHSISLDIDVRRFANRWSPITQRYETLWDKDIAQNYLELFDSFLSDEARQTLQELAHPSVK